MNVWIQLDEDLGKAVCSIRDDGISFQVQARLSETGQKGFGLIGIQERKRDRRHIADHIAARFGNHAANCCSQGEFTCQLESCSLMTMSSCGKA